MSVADRMPSEARTLSRALARLARELVQEAVRDKANRRAALLEASRLLAEHDAMAAELAAIRQTRAA